MINNFTKITKIIQSFSLLLLLTLGGIRTKAVAIPSDQTQVSSQICPLDLTREIEQIINRPELKRSRWGILIKTLESDQKIYSLEADKYFIPASNTKLLTTAATLHKFGANYVINTPIYISGSAPNLKTLRIVGQGDPTFTTEDLKQIAQQLKDQEISEIDQLIVSESNFERPAINPTWEWSDIYHYYAVAVNSLILNENTFKLQIIPQQPGQPTKLEWSDSIAKEQWQINNQSVTIDQENIDRISIDGVLGKPILEITGEIGINTQPHSPSITVLDPASYFLESLRTILTESGIKVNQVSLNNSSSIPSETEWLKINSHTLSYLITKTNQDSNNLFAEALVQLLGKTNNSLSGIEVMKETLTDLGIDPTTYRLRDGSGLSRHNLVSPEALVQTLKLIAKTPQGQVYQDSLPIAGVNGTLSRRFLGTVLEGNLTAKTGTMTGVSALSGYLNVPDYQPLVFSIIVNKSDQSGINLREHIDQIVLLMRKLKSC
jgi:serine-type D-Ala-D-Ala carboxypeptidase/endopeptidase (penicillin-binding protein 4)